MLSMQCLSLITKTCFCPTLTNVLHNFPRSSGQEKDEKDNNATISVFVNREVMMDITGYNINFTTITSIFLSQHGTLMYIARKDIVEICNLHARMYSNEPNL